MIENSISFRDSDKDVLSFVPTVDGTAVIVQAYDHATGKANYVKLEPLQLMALRDYLNQHFTAAVGNPDPEYIRHGW